VPVTIVFDNTGSMSAPFGARPCSDCPFHCSRHGLADLSRHERAKAAWLGCEAAGGALDAWTATTTLGLVGFSGPGAYLLACPGANTSLVVNRIEESVAQDTGDLVFGVLVAAREMSRSLVSNEVRSGPAAIVLMTDGNRGVPTPPLAVDLACDGSTVSVPFDSPEILSAHLFQHDILCNAAGDQPIRTYAVAFDPPFGDALAMMAARGGGAYYAVSTATEAQAALQAILDELR
jgi:hypothetical protein